MELLIHTNYPQVVKMNYNKMLSNRYKIVIDKSLDFMLNVLDMTRYDEPVTRTKKSKRFQRMKLSNFQNLKLINKSKVKKIKTKSSELVICKFHLYFLYFLFHTADKSQASFSADQFIQFFLLSCYIL